MNAATRLALEDLVRKLVNGEYDELERLTDGRRLSAALLAEAVSDYGRTLRMPPSEVGWCDEIQVAGRVPPKWSVVCDLWTVEEGRSDLSLELTVTEDSSGPIFEIDGLHVR